MTKINIFSDFITLGQLLKMTDTIASGGETKFYLQTHKIYVNKELENRRGRKLYPGDEIKIENNIYLICK